MSISRVFALMNPLWSTCPAKRRRTYQQCKWMRITRSFLLTDDYRYLKVKTLSFICNWIMHEDESGMQMYAYDCRWSRRRDVLQRSMVEGCGALRERLTVSVAGCQTSPTSDTACSQKKKHEFKTNSNHRSSFGLQKKNIGYPFFMTPSFVFPNASSGVLSPGEWALSALILPALNHAWPWCITRSWAWRRDTNRRERCYTSPAAVQYSSSLVLLLSTKSSNLPPGLRTKLFIRASEPYLSLCSLSPVLHLSGLDLKTDRNAHMSVFSIIISSRSRTVKCEPSVLQGLHVH